MNTIRQLLLPALYITASIFMLDGCSWFKKEVPPTAGPERRHYDTAPFSISEEVSTSPDTRLVANIPAGWLFVENDEGSRGGTYAIAVNPEYTLSIVFSVHTAPLGPTLQVDTLAPVELARAMYERRRTRSNLPLTLPSNPYEGISGTRTFGVYEFATSIAGNMISAVIAGDAATVYEVSVLPLMVTAKDPPQKNVIEKVLATVLTSIQ